MICSELKNSIFFYSVFLLIFLIISYRRRDNTWLQAIPGSGIVRVIWEEIELYKKN